MRPKPLSLQKRLISYDRILALELVLCGQCFENMKSEECHLKATQRPVQLAVHYVSRTIKPLGEPVLMD